MRDDINVPRIQILANKFDLFSEFGGVLLNSIGLRSIAEFLARIHFRYRRICTDGV